jgi:hypothetical protein
MKKLLLAGIAVLLMATSALAQSSGPGGYGSAFGGGLTGAPMGGGGTYQSQPTLTPRQAACIRANMNNLAAMRRCRGLRAR